MEIRDILDLSLNIVLLITVPLLFLAVVKFLLDWGVYLKNIFEDSYPRTYEQLYEIALEAVHYAESMGLGKMGHEKLEMAVEYFQSQLDANGFDEIDLEKIVEKIEAVLEIEINQYKEKFKPDGIA